MKTVQDAQQLRQLEQDPFYLSAFMIQMWAGHALMAVTAEYAEKKDPRTRALQSGQTWQSFCETLVTNFLKADRPPSSPLAPFRPDELDPVNITLFISDIFRLIRYEHPVADTLRKAMNCYLAELGDSQEELRKPVTQPIAEFQRICDWLDCILHLQTHLAWHMAPVAFDPDRDKRHLARLGFHQRHFDKIDPQMKASWFDDFKAAAERFARSPKWKALAEGLNSDATRVWNYRDVDTAIITLWPLVKRHNWTYADLLKVIRPILKRPTAYPCDSEQNISMYCINVLGLRKTGKGRTAKGEPVGADVARRLLGIKA